MTIVGLSGKAGSGKDTVADYLVENHNFTKLAFAGVLKEGMKILFDLSDQQLNDPIEKETIDPRWNKSPRQLMQWLGTDILRNNVRNDFFVEHIKNKISRCNGNIVISDVRFEDEASSLKDLGATIIRINRPGHTGTLNSTHASEQFKFEPDYIILNNSTKNELYSKVLNLI